MNRSTENVFPSSKAFADYLTSAEHDDFMVRAVIRVMNVSGVQATVFASSVRRRLDDVLNNCSILVEYRKNSDIVITWYERTEYESILFALYRHQVDIGYDEVTAMKLAKAQRDALMLLPMYEGRFNSDAR